jgi:tRNA dimethylallyltransferase
MNKGLLEEAKSLHSFKQLNALQTVGYKEIFAFLNNESTLHQAVENIKKNTRRFAKRQLTWFKKDKNIKWFEPNQLIKIQKVISEL